MESSTKGIFIVIIIIIVMKAIKINFYHYNNIIDKNIDHVYACKSDDNSLSIVYLYIKINKLQYYTYIYDIFCNRT